MISTLFKKYSIEAILLFLLGLSLPFKDQYSTIVMLVSLFFALLSLKSTRIDIRSAKVFLIVIALLLLPRLIGFVYFQTEPSTKELVRSLPFLIIPFYFFIFKHKDTNPKLIKSFFTGLIIAIILVFLICEIRVIYSIITKEQPIGYIMRWRYLNFNFTKPIDVHPAYLGILVNWCLLYIIEYKPFRTKLKAFILVCFVLLLIQSIARNALIVAGFIMLYYVFKQGRTEFKYAFIAGALIVAAVSYFHPSDYLRNKIFFVFVDDNPLEDNRFNRLKASYNVFLQAPLIGVGPGNDNDLRTIEYKKLNEDIAFQKRYNSHNQFFEYLSTYGLIGALCFITVLFILVGVAKQPLYLRIMVLAFIFASLTESLLERSLGVKSLSIIMGLILLYKKDSTLEGK